MKLAIKTGLAIGLYVVCALIVTAGVGAIGWSLAWSHDAERLWTQHRYVSLVLMFMGIGFWLERSAYALQELRAYAAAAWHRWTSSRERRAARKRLKLLIQDEQPPSTQPSKRIRLRTIRETS